MRPTPPIFSFPTSVSLIFLFQNGFFEVEAPTFNSQLYSVSNTACMKPISIHNPFTANLHVIHTVLCGGQSAGHWSGIKIGMKTVDEAEQIYSVPISCSKVNKDYVDNTWFRKDGNLVTFHRCNINWLYIRVRPTSTPESLHSIRTSQWCLTLSPVRTTLKSLTSFRPPSRTTEERFVHMSTWPLFFYYVEQTGNTVSHE